VTLCPVGVWLVLIVGLVVVIAVGYYQWQREQKRKEELLTWAVSNNWTISAADDSLCQRWTGDPFGEGDHRHVRNVINGTWKTTPFVSFDYSYQTHSSDGRGGRSTTTHHYAVTALNLPAWLPTLQVTPENLLTRLGNAVGITDIELESEDFNRAFRVHASDPKLASDVLTPRSMQLLLSRPHFSWRIEGADILCWQEGEQHPADVTAVVCTLLDVVNGIPSFVWHDHGSDAGSATVGGTT
jgi:hypothetical protein